MRITFLILGLAWPVFSFSQISNSTDYFLKACGGGFGDKGVTGAIAINNPGANKATVQYVINKMLAAHGGMAKWKSSPTLSFTHILVYGQPLETEFWVSNETTETKKKNGPIMTGRYLIAALLMTVKKHGRKTGSWTIRPAPMSTIFIMPWLCPGLHNKKELYWRQCR
jgi:hypothetical protein